MCKGWEEMMSRSVKKKVSERKRLGISNIVDFVKSNDNNYSKVIQFQCSRAKSLQKYLIDDAVRDDVHYISKTYIVFDEDADMIVAYFSLRTACIIRNCIENRKNETLVENIIPCIELAKLCVNEQYLEWLRKNDYIDNGVGTYVFDTFIVPLLAVLTEFIGFLEVIIFAICDKDGKVVNAYRKHMGFETIEEDKDKIVSVFDDASIIVDKYSDGCTFMHMEVEEVIKKYEGGKSNVGIFG